MKRFVGFYNYTVILTFASLVISIIGMAQCLHGNYKAAILCLMASGVCDAFDGRIARTRDKSTEDERNFGIQLDSLCDVVCFGVFPAILCYMLGCRGVIGIICVCFFALCAVIRLAYFNVLETKRQQVEEERTAKYYHGLPVTSIAVILPIVFAFQYFVPALLFYILLHLMLLIVGFAFIYDFHMPKPNLKALIIVMAILAFCVFVVFALTEFRPPRFTVDSNPIVSAFTENEDAAFDNEEGGLSGITPSNQRDSDNSQSVIKPNGQLRLQSDESE